MPVTAAALIDSFHHDANVAALIVDHLAGAKIQADMRFVLGVRGADSK